MTEVLHRAFIHQTNGFIHISDGEEEIIYETVDEFLLDAPTYTLPANGRGQSYEEIATMPFYHVIMDDGSVMVGEFPAPEFENYINNVSMYKSAQEVRQHPLTPWPDLPDAKNETTWHIRQKAWLLLSATDWWVTKNSESGDPIPAKVVTYRSGIKTESTNREAAVVAAANVSEVKIIFDAIHDNNWPTIDMYYVRGVIPPHITSPTP